MASLLSKTKDIICMLEMANNDTKYEVCIPVIIMYMCRRAQAVLCADRSCVQCVDVKGYIRPNWYKCWGNAAIRFSSDNVRAVFDDQCPLTCIVVRTRVGSVRSMMKWSYMVVCAACWMQRWSLGLCICRN